MELTPEVKQELCQQVKSVLAWSQGYESLNVEPLIDHWFQSKQKIIEAFSNVNDELAFGCELDETVEMDLSEQEKEYKFNNFLGAIGWSDEVQPLRDFVNANKKDFFNNLVTEDYTFQNTVIKKGSKLLKAFKYFIKDEETRKWLQDKASVAIQESKITGHLCISVHPLDFLSVSENTYNWRSCHALDGEYRTGNLNYMCDKSTIVCYIKGADEAILPHFPENIKWNSKKWRCLLFLSDNWDAMFAGRQYPMTLDKMLDRIQQMAKVCLNLTGTWSEWHDDQITEFKYRIKNSVDQQNFVNPYIPMAGKIYSIRNLIKDGERTFHYNDLLRSTCYIPYYCWSREWNKENIHFHIGEEVKCLQCGQGQIRDSDIMLCDDCYNQDNDDRSECDACGYVASTNDLYFIERYGIWVCSWCYEHNYGTCQYCDDIVHIDDLEEISGHCYCHECIDNYNLREQENR